MTLTCSRCRSDAESVMSFDYSGRCMWLSDIEGPLEPGSGYLLCSQHAARLSPPVGWTLIDRRAPMARLFTIPAQEALLPIDRDVLEAVREMDEPELRRLLILARARLEQRGVFSSNAEPEVKLRRQMVRCGKDACTRCPHGPYWYAYWWEEGKRRSRYVGKLDELPEMA